ncbi:Uncharacterised protein [Mycobacterium tuberculosis]|uniref:Uncharacterized protein n=1 Tax=Mycobacterium tuberculosis TaxID=1773 RepID=A0A655IXX4_MYCTX|nr:Uncharacterised protein [Mycobacterium tuberculosis]CNM64856.1 Uncharacterised protein [Mycobacterium tuberculosis]CNM75700.1 Uncharacterised protein [Mycobacterium tuberculosis]CNM99668.1 Uncharacterised protein [Mycobacterium tuberculosis]CNN07856.1 Uncharacterised protein [Mycobacterium tuberculosis]
MRREIAVCSAAAHNASRRCRCVPALAAATSALADGNCPSCILIQPESSRCRRWNSGSAPARTARPITLRARTGSPACIAAKVTSAAGLSGMTWLSDCSVAMAWPSFAIATGYG